MANPFREELTSDSSVVAVVRGTTNINADGSVTFRGALGKGSGRPIEISAEEFPKFVEAIKYIDEIRETEAAKEKDRLVALETDKTVDSE